MSDNLNVGDLTLIASSAGSQQLVGQSCEVLALHRGYGPTAFCGRAYNCLTVEPCAFVELASGEIWLFELRRLLPLKREAVTLSGKMVGVIE